ncbi:MAG TPA: bifunctional phosphoribosylaminoimidazolecarboxamide formyltransferase/IMP cyclohydrolase [Candidatus Sulfotelmatobacter sp.]|jgi:phosphoribosylaminoimidazolecarboxamide formyltransferase/IMP cyclohydrolase|nr:bifunctional phosphoribosylaminoimidazolecarboxamide formyltransferase/IMP cyclohydrolase [Candidatus Sulfotelmatobacter sp.]
MAKKYALLSVYDKTDIIPFAKAISKAGYEIISTGGTAKALQAEKIPYIPIQEITGNPESFDGRMKTISFQIESALLYDRTNPQHLKEADTLQIKQIDIVVCNLYPFEKTITDKKVTFKKAIENIDVGGPTMIRSAAKNSLIVVIDPTDYQIVSNALQKKGFPPKLTRYLQAKAFDHLTFYDSQIAWYFNSQSDEITFPKEITIPGRKLLDLRYGENPHQKGAVYTRPNFQTPLQHLTKHWGRDLSLINVTDINAGLESVRVFAQPAAVIIKHNSPCGIALGTNAAEALTRAIASDPESAFGGIVILNKPMDLTAAKIIGSFKDAKRGNMDIIAAPHIKKDALAFLQAVRKSMGIYTFGDIPTLSDQWNMKSLDGGFILQTADIDIDESFKQWQVVTKKKPTKQQLQQMQIGWKFVTKIKSNTILIVDKNLPMTRGIGAGQTSRIRSTKIALEQADKHTQDGILISDSFFPFPDSVALAAKHGIAGIVQQGGSINDEKSIDAANKADIPMIFTGRRAFWH